MTFAHPSPYLRPSDHPDYLLLERLDSQVLRRTPLYIRSGQDFILYKNNSAELDLERLREENLERRLYVKRSDRAQAIADIQEELASQQLRSLLRGGDVALAKLAFVNLLEEALADPRVRVLEGFQGMVGVLLDEFAQDDKLAQAFLLVGGQSYGLAEKAVNVLALVGGMAVRLGIPHSQQVEMGLAALLHDLGKSRLPSHLRLPGRQLSQEEFSLLRKHPLLGGEMLEGGNFGARVRQGVMEHHERLDGSGYPRGLRQISLAGQAVGLADSYESLTNPWPERPKRLTALEALSLLKREVDQGKYEARLFECLAYSLIR